MTQSNGWWALGSVIKQNHPSWCIIHLAGGREWEVGLLSEMSVFEELSVCGVFFCLGICKHLSVYGCPCLFLTHWVSHSHHSLSLCARTYMCTIYSLIDVPVYISLVYRSLCVSFLGCSHSKYHCFSYFCLSLCVAKQLFLCQFVSLSLIMAIVLSLKFSPPHQFCLFVNSLYH